ncbi:MAG: Hsp70 family protein [Chitinophagaceae bacterium]
MASTIDFGIDLGTTNSLIARSGKNGIEIFRNPAGMKETLPSVVAFRKERILIGDKAREHIEKDPLNVFGSFKRKMGTSESFFVASSTSFITPIELSSMVLQELKNFIYSGEQPLSMVITIPASFDTIQSNATKEAGHLAGFKEVVLLQEPIAASLAFANKTGTEEIGGQWLVYDLGGGTFDVALVTIDEAEMNVADHEGDNFFGGLDFDSLIVTGIVVPYLEKQYGLTNVDEEMRSAKGLYNKLWYQLLYKAEEAKITLSSQQSADIEFEFTDGNGNEHEVFFSIERQHFEAIVRDKIIYSVDFIDKLLQRNKLLPSDIKEVILVGGSTYIPLVRHTIENRLGIKINCSVDPTTAVVVGAAYYAGTKTKYVPDASAHADALAQAEKKATASDIMVKMAYQKASRETEEYFTAAITNLPQGTWYRITRDDGGYDSGFKSAEDRISEMLHLLPDSMNVFKLRLYTSNRQQLEAAIDSINIVQGKFSIYGQPLPNDICLEVDDTSTQTTHLEVIFEKNALLPIKRTITKTISRTIARGSDDQLVINVLEGSRYASPQTNLPIGIVSIRGKDLKTDIIKGCDIDITFEISESRDITIEAYVSMIDQEYKEVFNPSSRAVNIERLKEETGYLLSVGERNRAKLVEKEKYEQSAILQAAIDKLNDLNKRLRKLKQDDVTDTKYQLDEEKRKLAQVIDTSGKEDRLIEFKEDYFDAKDSCNYYLNQGGEAAAFLMKRFDEIIAAENEWLNADSTTTIKRKITELNKLSWDIRRKDISHVIHIYMYYATKDNAEYKDTKKAAQLKARGDAALERKNVDEMLSIIYQLYDILIDKDNDEVLKGTGLK